MVFQHSPGFVNWIQIKWGQPAPQTLCRQQTKHCAVSHRKVSNISRLLYNACCSQKVMPHKS